MKLVGKRIILRPYVATDFATLKRSHDARLPARNRFDEAVRTSALERDDFRAKSKRKRELARDGNHYIFGVFDKKSGEFIGEVDLMTLNRGLRWANLGYNIHNQYWGKGFATEATQLALKAGFGPLKYHRIEAGCERSNRASQKVARRIGLVKEGVRLKFFPHNGGVDLVMFAQNAIDYRKRK